MTDQEIEKKYSKSFENDYWEKTIKSAMISFANACLIQENEKHKQLISNENKSFNKKQENSMNFYLDSNQLKKLKKWQKKIKKKFGEYGKYRFIFTPTGIGDDVKVYSEISDKTLDLTDVENW